MPDSATQIRQKLIECDLESLFIEELGWNHHRTAPLITKNNGITYTLGAIAEKHGMVTWECHPGPDGQIPDYPTRGKIDRQVAKITHEHIIVFVNQERTVQTWHWVKCEKGKPTACREHTFLSHQSGELLIQKLRNLVISLEEEEDLTIIEVTGKVKQAFDIDRVTKRFYDDFKKEHGVFLSFIEGIEVVTNREWYASLMLNRLMFIYFIQKKEFLDGDSHYLRNRLQMVRQSQGEGKFHSFYRYFLLRLFHEGLGQPEVDRKAELRQLLGTVPYLNGGLFDTHQLEKDNPDIHIPDEAFERLFDFFDQWEWHLDTRPMRKGNEINPDVLGYIFEKYINNQAEMGAYYTKEDITEYISKNTIVPFLFDSAEKKCAIAFEPEAAMWNLLSSDPDRYIYNVVKKGVNLPLPDDIAEGVHDISKRNSWNRTADEEYALPTETWREHVARRTRYLEVRQKLTSGEIHSINDLITYNLDLRQFAQDVIENSEGTELLRAFFKSIEEMSVLDPTCGSGAFLFAALNVLEPLYEACLERMEIFVSELDRSGEEHRTEKFSDFRRVLEQANDRSKHPSRTYFILKSIVLRNLYGVDIMEEAVEICKLRLFLKLMAQVERVKGVEPLPDIDFNIRAGNTLVGFTSLEAVRQAMTITVKGQRRLPSPEDESILQRIDESAELANKAFHRFHLQQSEYGIQAKEYITAKEELNRRLRTLRQELDKYLAKEYGKDPDKQDDFENWLSSHQPFHWFSEFYGIMHKGGFDVIIGNPPFLETRQIDYDPLGFKTRESDAVHAMCVERSLHLLGDTGCISLIMPMALVSTQRMATVQKLLEEHGVVWYSNYSWRPGKLFDSVNRAISFFITTSKSSERVFSTKYQKWISETRNFLIPCIEYAEVIADRKAYWVPKIGTNLENVLLGKLLINEAKLGSYFSKSENKIYYRTTGGLYWKVFTNFAPVFIVNGVKGHSTRETSFSLVDKQMVLSTISILSSDIYWWWYTITSNLRDLNPSDIVNFPINIDALYDDQLIQLGQVYMDDLEKNSSMLTRQQKQTGTTITQSFKIQKSKAIIDEIDRVLAKHYGFTEEELEFIINYDIKYRVGIDTDEENSF